MWAVQGSVPPLITARVSCGLPDGLSRLWNMNWRSWQETCHPRTSTSSPPAPSSSFCWTCCSRSTPAGILSLSLTRIAQTRIIALYQERYPCFLLTLTHRSAFEDAVSLSQCLYFLYNLFDFNYFIFFLVYVHILLSAAATTQFPLGNYENLILSHLI